MSALYKSSVELLDGDAGPSSGDESRLRDQFAIAYIQAQVQAGASYETWGDLSGDAYKMADAMLKERSRGR